MSKYLTIIGIPIAFFSLLLLTPSSTSAQFGFTPKQAQEKAHHGVLSTTQGRFAFGQVSESSEGTFMLDTVTGRLWRLTKKTDIGLCLTAIPYQSNDGKCSSMPPHIPELYSKGGKEK